MVRRTTREQYTREPVFPRTLVASYPDEAPANVDAGTYKTNTANVIEPDAAAVFSFLPPPGPAGLTIDTTAGSGGVDAQEGLYRLTLDLALDGTSGEPRIAVTDAAGTTTYLEWDSAGAATPDLATRVSITGYAELTAAGRFVLRIAADAGILNARDIQLHVQKIATITP